MNEQPVEKMNLMDDGSLDVQCIWDTVQGECLFAGCPATFVRLAGCNYFCPGCDTDYTSGRERMIVERILSRILNLPDRNLVVFTGGEPLRQNIMPVVTHLLSMGKDVQIETNGTVLGPLAGIDKEAYERVVGTHNRLYIVCSPKSSRVDPLLASNWVDAWKYVVKKGEIGEDGLPTRVLGQSTPVARPPAGNTSPIYIQPMDEGDVFKNSDNTREALESCIKHGYRLSIQIHKLISMP